MGRIRGRWIKSLSRKLVEKYPDKFSTNFESNKKTLVEMNLLEDKPIRNKVAGYIVDVIEKKVIE
jgi:small subunit ribosomal protein S17e